MRPTALALSPHLDDAVFSCGGTLALMARGGWRVVVATLFTRSVPDPQGFALSCQIDKGLGADVDYMALRRDEDVAAMQALGVDRPLHVMLPEAPHRGYHAPHALFEPPLAADPIMGALRSAVAELLDAHAPDLVLAPQAIGGHVDHVQLVRAMADVVRPVVWWRDFPYTIRHDRPRRPFADRFAALPIRSVTLDGAALAAREAACGAYRSQLGTQFGGAEALKIKLAEAGPVESFNGLPDLACFA